MKNVHLSVWTENFTQSIEAASMSKGNHHEEKFLFKKLQESVAAMKKICKKLQEADDPTNFYNNLCIYIQEAKNCMYWYERSLDYEIVNLSNSQLILSQGNSMINVLEATLRVIKYQYTIN
ncbi:MAG TPA: hypothetical protein PKJ62_05880 [Bacteroidia bacterium]|nr:hypothetical protein [Bacteroidia bacterium]HNS13530.1 hypothetical protein [Bacteroidia bacterium]